MFRQHDRWPTLLVQLSAVSAALVASWLLRFDFSFPHVELVVTVLPLLIASRWLALSAFHLTHSYWRYTGLSDLKSLVKCIIAGSVLFSTAVLCSLSPGPFPAFLPVSVYILEAVLSLLFLAALRACAALVLQAHVAPPEGNRTRVLIVGAGFAGAMLEKALRASRYEVVAIVDDNPQLKGTQLAGIPVLGGIDRIQVWADRLRVQEILIAIPSATASQLLRITDYCSKTGLPYRTVPNLRDLVEGTIAITELKEVDLDELLGREPVQFEPAGVRARLEDRVVMVTGAAGSIGSELCKQIVRFGPKKIVCIDQAETPLFHLQQRMFGETAVPVVCAVTDVGDRARMQQLIESHRVQVIFHAAAYKHVPMVEANTYEALRNNVFALQDLMDVAEYAGCEDFLLISSDKAVHPSSMMGCTKRLGELLISSRSRHRMRSLSVRFGNVLGSQGSVIPLFRSQIREGKALTITHPKVTRYFMTIPEAVALTLQAFTIGERGDILVLDMGEPVPIVELAKTLIRVSGKTEAEVPIVFTGLRPGEKLHESIFYDSEMRTQTSLPKVIRVCSDHVNASLFQHGMRRLEAAVRAHDDLEIRQRVKEMIPEYEWNPSAAETAEPEAGIHCNADRGQWLDMMPSRVQ